jgi:hypothetical protein
MVELFADFAQQNLLKFQRVTGRTRRAQQQLVGRDAFQKQADALVGLQAQRQDDFRVFGLYLCFSKIFSASVVNIK